MVRPSSVPWISHWVLVVVEIRPFKTNPLLWHVSLETPIRYYRCGQQLYQPHSSYWKVWWYASLLGSPLHGYVSVWPYVWLEMPQLSTTDMFWRMWSHCSNNRSAGGFRPTPISVLDWSQRESQDYQQRPNQHAYFLRRIIMCWFAESRIEINYVLLHHDWRDNVRTESDHSSCLRRDTSSSKRKCSSYP